jgi:hypothetical protein
MYSASRTNLNNVLHWLRGQDESQWEEVTQLLSETVSELQDLVHPPHREMTGGPSSESHSFSPQATAINVAMPSLMRMLNAMRNHNKVVALEHGEAAMEFLPEGDERSRAHAKR